MGKNVEIILVPTAADLKYQDTEVPEPKMINTELKEYLEPYLEDLTIDSTTTTTTE